MRVIDLLNKIASGEEVPRHIKNKGMNLYWNEEDYIYDIIEEDFRAPFYLFHNEELNDELEIIEDIPKEDNKIPEKLDKYADVSDKLACEWTFGEKKLKDKINEIIDYLNRKGE